VTRRVPPQDAGLLDVHVDMASSRDLASIAQIDAGMKEANDYIASLKSSRPTS